MRKISIKQILIQLLLFLLLISPCILFANIDKPFVVVLDAGHGGDDTGAIGVGGIYEKNITLDITLKLGQFIEEKYGKKVKVVYTRKNDVFIPLYGRAKIANDNHADLFISIHCNAAKSTAQGTETFVLGLHREEDNLNVAKRENSVIYLEENYETKYEGFNPNDPAAYIGFMLTVGEHQKQSIRIAKLIEDSFVSSSRQSRGVKQAGFLVIRETAMPSVLIETGFITNNEEGNLLAKESGRKDTAKSIFNAFIKYKEEYDEKNELKSANTTDSFQNNTIGSSTIKPTTTSENPVKEIDKTKDHYKVQFLVSKYSLDVNSPNFKGLRAVEKMQESNLYKYYYGKAYSEAEANRLLEEVKKKGFPDAFLVKTTPNKTKVSVNQYFTIQLFVSRRDLDLENRKFKGLKNIRKEEKDNFYNYYYGMEEEYIEVVKLYKKIKNQGFNDAIIQKKP